MLTAAFWIFASLMVFFGLMVIAQRNPVSSALSLVMTFLCLAALFFTLDAGFIGVIQILVYAGAVMVLFLFIIMLLDLKQEEGRKINGASLFSGLLVAGGGLYIVAAIILRSEVAERELPTLAVGRIDDVRAVGEVLFTNYNLPFQVIGVLLLAATIGVVVLSRKELR